MRKTLTAAFAVAVLSASAVVATTGTSSAGGYYGGHYGGYHKSYYGGYGHGYGYGYQNCFWKKVKVWGYHGYFWKKIKVCH